MTTTRAEPEWSAECERMERPRGAGNTDRGLTHLSDLTGRGLRVSVPSKSWKRPDLAARNRGDGGPYEDAEWCRTRYEGGMTLREIAAEAGCSLRTVARWMKIHGVEMATPVEKRKQRGTPWPDPVATRCALCGGRKAHGAKACWDCHDRTGVNGSNWRGDQIGIAGAHIRVARRYGKATTHTCLRCAAPASHWAYDHSDPEERQSPEDGPYSLDPGRYMPLCVRCHKRFDLDYLRQKAIEESE